MTDQGLTAGQLLGMSSSYWKTCALHTGVKLEVFSTLAEEGGLTAGELADRLSLDTDATERLLLALAALGLVRKSEEGYRNTGSADRYLTRGSPETVGHLIRHHHHLMQSWVDLDRAVRNGTPVGPRSSFSPEDMRESFLMGMHDSAMQQAPGLVGTLELTDRNHLLDLGGGPGTYAVHFCLSNPGLRATVYDLPTSRPFAEQVIQRFDLADRIDFTEGNYLTESVDGTYDVAWLSHILHAEDPAGCRAILEKTVNALAPRGLIIVQEFILDDNGTGPLFPALFSLNMLVRTEGGRAYTEGELMEMLTESGAVHLERTAYRGPNDSGLIVGRAGI